MVELLTLYSTALTLAAKQILESPNSSQSLEMKSILFRDDFVDTLGLSRTHQIILGLIPGSLTTEAQKLSSCGDLDHLDLMGKSALHWAAWREDIDAICKLVTARVDVNILTSSQTTPLFETARKHSAETIEALMLSGADETIQDAYGLTALHYGLLMKDDEVDIAWLKALVPNSIKLMKMNITEWSVIHCCSKNNLVQCGRYLIELGADINQLSNGGGPPLFVAVVKGSIEFLQLLLENGARYDGTDVQGRTILHVLASHGNPESAGVLTRAKLRGLDADAKDHQNRTPRDYLRQRAMVPLGFVEAFESLLESIREANSYEAVDDEFQLEVFHDAVETKTESTDDLSESHRAI